MADKKYTPRMKQRYDDVIVKALVEKAGLNEGSNAAPAEFVIERAFVG